ncbi:MFS transporter, DHA1 family, tetracycline resistance protein [Chitinophaga eiseniae]|uniref:MFS transporter, DHA1 family, tetracycline resistance protein n=1 Tax=Chitinophaga eiseniae TaxID=634771 RepID=A0A1T4NE10_9BACT|nr:MFS transporter, DHA1 family, tetracycline resistance protein [Chitinophaga eiseniae]
MAVYFSYFSYCILMQSAYYRSRLLFIVLVVVIDTAGFGLIFPVLPQLLRELLHADISTAARYGGWLAFAYAAMQFIFAPVLGGLSDRYGRRPVLLSSLLGFSVDCLFLAFAPNVTWLFAGRAIAGITGASYAVASACVADISTDENRTRHYGLINAAFGLGFIIGPVIGGTLGRWGTHTPFMVAAALSFLNFLLGYYFFPESLPLAHRRAFDWKRANPLGALQHLVRFPLVKSLIFSMMLVSFATHSMESVWAFFTIEKFKWSNLLVGYSLAFVGVLSIISQTWLVGVLTKRLSDRQMAVTGLLCMITGFLLFAFAGWQWILLPALVIYIAGSIQGTAMQSIVAGAMPDNEQGELQGGLGSLMGLTTLLAPPLLTSSFAWATARTSPVYFPGMPYLIAGILTFFSLLLLLRGFRKTAR